MTEEQVEKSLAEQKIELGGKWKPKNCRARHHVAILIPFRDRHAHLTNFLLNMHPIFARQQISYGIYLIEPMQGIKFNRGLLLNIGFNESNNDGNGSWQCHAFHDVGELMKTHFTKTSFYFSFLFCLGLPLIRRSVNIFCVYLNKISFFNHWVFQTQDDRTLYTCPENPTHLVERIRQEIYKYIDPIFVMKMYNLGQKLYLFKANITTSNTVNFVLKTR
jgi:hypothetical protein